MIIRKGSATTEYRNLVDKAAAVAENRKQGLTPMFHEKIDHLFDTYSRKLAENMNQQFAIDARVPSVMIAGRQLPHQEEGKPEPGP